MAEEGTFDSPLTAGSPHYPLPLWGLAKENYPTHNGKAEEAVGDGLTTPCRFEPCQKVAGFLEWGRFAPPGHSLKVQKNIQPPATFASNHRHVLDRNPLKGG